MSIRVEELDKKRSNVNEIFTEYEYFQKNIVHNHV